MQGVEKERKVMQTSVGSRVVAVRKKRPKRPSLVGGGQPGVFYRRRVSK